MHHEETRDAMKAEREDNTPLNRAIDFLLNRYEHCETRAEAVATLASCLEDKPIMAEAILDEWHALPWERRRKMLIPELNDKTIRDWLTPYIEG